MRPTVLLVVGVAAVLLVGSLLGPIGVVLLLAGVAAATAYAWKVCGRLALHAMQAYPVSEAQQPALYRLVRELSTASRRPIPRLYLSPTEAPNAFAAGRGRRQSAICCTEGLLARLDERELRAVLAHELAHVHARDLRAASMAAAFATGVLHPAQLTWHPPDSADNDAGGLIGSVLLLLLAPVAAAVLWLGVRRSREFEADADAVGLTGDVLGLAQALRRLDADTRVLPLRPDPRVRAASAAMIVTPFGPGFVTRLLDPRPPTAERVARLEALAGYRR